MKTINNLMEEIQDNKDIISITKILYLQDDVNEYFNLDIEMIINELDKKVYNLRFINVSNFSIKNVTKEINVLGFNIIDHKTDGWNKEIRFEIFDYENARIHLFCESMQVIK